MPISLKLLALFRGASSPTKSLPQERNPPAHTNKASKTKRSKAKVANTKSAMQLKNVGVTDVTKVTI